MMTKGRALRLARRAARVEAIALRKDLAAYAMPADLLDLSAMLDRYDDTQTREIRALIDVTRAA